LDISWSLRCLTWGVQEKLGKRRGREKEAEGEITRNLGNGTEEEWGLKHFQET